MIINYEEIKVKYGNTVELCCRMIVYNKFSDDGPDKRFSELFKALKLFFSDDVINLSNRIVSESLGKL